MATAIAAPRNPAGNSFSLENFNSVLLKELEENLGCLAVTTNSNSNVLVGTENGAFLLTAEGRTVSSFMVGLKGCLHEIPSVQFCPKNPNVIYLATKNTVTAFDTRIDCSGSGLLAEKAENNQVAFFNDNTDEINQLSISNNHLAACDDNGEIRIYDTVANRCFRTLRNRHKNICSSVCFRPNKASEVLSAGLDCQVLLWNYSKIRVLSSSNTQEIFSQNQSHSVYMMSPPMVNDIDCLQDGTQLACGIGNGSIIVYDISKARQLKMLQTLNQHSTLGVSCIKFFRFENHNYLLSGGNDCRLNMWKFPMDLWSPMEKTMPLSCEHQQVLMTSKVNCFTSHLASSKLIFVVCDQSRKLRYFEVAEQTCV